jgi:hypothetical protein
VELNIVPVLELNDLIMLVIAVLLFVSIVALVWGIRNKDRIPGKPGEREWPD